MIINRGHKKYTFPLIGLLFYVIFTSSISFPSSFTIVRNIAPPINITSFLNKTGCCQNDSNGNSIGYTIISLDGYKSTSTPVSIQNGISPLSIWVNAFSSIAVMKAGLGGNTTSSIQQYLLQSYHQYGVKLLMNVFADEAPISANNVSASVVAQGIINAVQTYQLDGVSVEFGDFHAVSEGTASAWLLTLLSSLRVGLKGQKIVMIIPVTMINRVALFQQSLVSALVDLFVLKYYGFIQSDYTNYNTLFVNSSVFPQTAIAQLLKSQTVGVDLCRTVIAKPASSNMDSYIDSATLGNAFQSARATFGWFGGYANLDFESDFNGRFQSTVLQQIRNDCLQNGYCYCL